jgi:hypothetical protein
MESEDGKLKRFFKNKENQTITYLLIAALLVNLANYIFFYNQTNVFYSLFSFLAFVAGLIGISMIPFAVAAFIAVFFLIPRKRKHKYFYFLSIIFIILSIFSFWISCSTQ